MLITAKVRGGGKVMFNPEHVIIQEAFGRGDTSTEEEKPLGHRESLGFCWLMNEAGSPIAELDHTFEEMVNFSAGS